MGELNGRHVTSNSRPWTCTSVAAIKLLDTTYPQVAALPEPEMRPAWCHATR